MSAADPSLNTVLCETFDLRMPIVAGGLQWLANAEYVSAAARAGVLPFLTAASFPDPDDLRAQIRRTRDLAEGHAFGVNVSMLPKLVPGEQTEPIFRLIIEEGIKVVETSGRNPEPYLPLLREAGVKVLHKVPSVRYAVKAQSIGVDMVSIVGAECGGHPGMDLVGTAVNMALAERQIKIPFLIGGGIGAGSQIIGALAAGAAGVVIGTRFLVAEQLPAHEGYKQALAQANERDTVLSMGTVRNTVRTLKNQTTEIVAKLEAENPQIGIETLMPYVAGRVGRIAYETGDVSHGMLAAGQALGLTDKIAPFEEIIAQLEAEALTALDRLRPNQESDGND